MNLNSDIQDTINDSEDVVLELSPHDTASESENENTDNGEDGEKGDSKKYFLGTDGIKWRNEIPSRNVSTSSTNIREMDWGEQRNDSNSEITNIFFNKNYIKLITNKRKRKYKWFFEKSEKKLHFANNESASWKREKYRE